nr:hypothetical protein Iba_chr06dCG8120 [Ipomoea batatas]
MSPGVPPNTSTNKIKETKDDDNDGATAAGRRLAAGEKRATAHLSGLEYFLQTASNPLSAKLECNEHRADTNQLEVPDRNSLRREKSIHDIDTQAVMLEVGKLVLIIRGVGVAVRKAMGQAVMLVVGNLVITRGVGGDASASKWSTQENTSGNLSSSWNSSQSNASEFEKSKACGATETRSLVGCPLDHLFNYALVVNGLSWEAILKPEV